LAEAGIRDRTGCTVVAVERDGEVMVEFGPEFRFRTSDAVYICGSNEAIRKYTQAFPQQ